MADERILAKCAEGRNGELVLSPAEGFWAKCPTLQVDPALSAYSLFDDFMELNRGPITNRWQMDSVGIASTANLGSSATYGLGGVVVLDAGISAKNDYVNLKAVDVDAPLGAFKITAASGKKLWYAMKFKLTAVTYDCICFGLLDGTTTKPFADDTGAESTVVVDGLYFRTLSGVLGAGGSVLDFARARNTAAEGVIKAGIATLVADTWITAGFFFDGVSAVIPYINGVQQPYPTAVNVATFPYDVGLTPYIGILASENASKKLVVDWVKVVQER